MELKNFWNNLSLVKKMEIIYEIKTNKKDINMKTLIKEIDNLAKHRQYHLITMLLEPFGIMCKEIIDLYPIKGVNLLKLEEKLNFMFEVYTNPDYYGYKTNEGKKLRDLLKKEVI